ncbi:MAG: IS701 family transposase [Acidobacteria bacterium]|nr:IS701 family transposase [Acidobacteriota bacterium]
MKHSTSQSNVTVEDATTWASSLEAVAERIKGLFPRAEPRQRVTAYLRGLISPVERKNGWQLAEQAGDAKPYGVQHLLGRAEWSADEVRDDLQAYVVEHLGDTEAVLVIDETGFLKKGIKSAGVARQYSGTAGRIENCQIGVFLTYAAPRGRTFLDRELYLPEAWASDDERRGAAGVPEEVMFATKPQLARKMIARALAAGVECAWVTGDSVYGNDGKLREWLEERRQPYVLGVTAQYRLFTERGREWASAIFGRLSARSWRRLSCGAGSKGERLYDWARVRARTIDRQRCRWLVARRSIDDPTEISYYIASATVATPLAELARVAGARWAIEESFETGKGEVGLEHYEVRSWTGWYRHITLAMLAHAYLSVVRAVAAGDEAQKKMGANSTRAAQAELRRRNLSR